MFKTKKLKQLSKYNYLGIILFFIYLSMAILIFIFLMLLTEPKVEPARLPEAKERIWFLECQSNDTETCNAITEESIKEGVNPQLMLDLAFCESSLNLKAIGLIDNDDRGAFQINRRFHKISDSCAFNVKCATLYTISQIQAGRGHLWDCWDRE